MKRSSQVALLLMGVSGVGAAGYAMTPSEPDCTPPAQQSSVAPGAAAIRGAAQPVVNPCPPRRHYTSYGRSNYNSHWSRPIFSGWGGSSPTSNTSFVAAHSSGSSVSGIVRGGFGSFAHAFARAGG